MTSAAYAEIYIAGNLCSSGGQIHQNQCMADIYRKADLRLNTVYKELVSVLKDPSGIIASQRAWLVYRDAECSNEVFQMGYVEQGKNTLFPFARDACLLRMTESRTKRLEWHLEQDCNNCPPRSNM